MGVSILTGLICSTEIVVSEFKLEVLDIIRKGVEVLAGLKSRSFSQRANISSLNSFLNASFFTIFSSFLAFPLAS